MSTDSEELFRMVRRRFRARGLVLFALGAVIAVAGASSFDPRGVMYALGGVLTAMAGAYLAIWIPVYLRRPDEIVRIELGAVDLQVTMENGHRHRLVIGLDEREAVKAALEQVGAARRVRARVVQR